MPKGTVSLLCLNLPVLPPLDNHLAVNPEGYLLRNLLWSSKSCNRATTGQRSIQGRDWAFLQRPITRKLPMVKWAAGQAGNFSRQGATMASAEDALVSFVVEVLIRI